MATVQFSVPDDVLAAFNAKFPQDVRDRLLVALIEQVIEPDPYSEEALAEDDRRYDEASLPGKTYTTEEVIAKLKAQLRRAGLPCDG